MYWQLLCTFDTQRKNKKKIVFNFFHNFTLKKEFENGFQNQKTYTQLQKIWK